MVTALDVANFFIVYSRESDDPMTNMRLNKFVYLAQGYSLAMLGKPLFDDQIQAWDYGPVIPALYYLFRSDVRGDPILDTVGEYSSDVFDESQFAVLSEVFADFSPYSTNAITDYTHRPGSPWAQAYKGSHSNRPIPLDSMKQYFSQFKDPGMLDEFGDISDIPGYTDQDGVVHLPEDFDYDRSSRSP